jgi:hypothetical protein
MEAEAGSLESDRAGVIRGPDALSRAFVTAHQRCVRAPPKTRRRHLCRGGEPSLTESGLEKERPVLRNRCTSDVLPPRRVTPEDRTRGDALSPAAASLQPAAA